MKTDGAVLLDCSGMTQAAAGGTVTPVGEPVARAWGPVIAGFTTAEGLHVGVLDELPGLVDGYRIAIPPGAAYVHIEYPG